MTDDELDDIEKEMNEIHENFKRSEIEGAQNILRYFDRIHDKLFTFNNILIAGYFALSQFFESFSVYGIIIPLLNLALLIIIEYRMMEKSRFDSQVTKKTSEEINKNGTNINKTTRYSLYSIISTSIVVIIFIFNLFSLDSKAINTIKNNQPIQQVVDTIGSDVNNNLIIAAWTDNETENATLAFDIDSVIYVDLLKYYKYELFNDTLIRYFEEMIDTSIIVKLNNDSLIIKNKYGTEEYKKFNE
ncbi:hypothetical protein [Draconibacterium sediminis]|uniref:hypothetical protein n=1 Tax=Draconibacterium sediminis TaxID=1544798 RepID=UPI000696F157|nr:hypothetical protein [Draconibacterium sediminis]